MRDDPSLSATAKGLILNHANHKFVSVATCWEIAIKATRKRLALTEPSGVLLGRELPRLGFDLLQIDLRHATHVELLPEFHKDPFDRLIVAQSLLEDMALVSIDAQVDPYGVKRLW